MKTNKKIILLLSCASMHLLYADFIDIERELYEPLEEMRQMDESMNNAIEQRREENQILIDEQQQIDLDLPMPDFELEGNQYVLIKNVSDAKHTKIDVKLEQRMLKISTVTTTMRDMMTEMGMQNSSFESRMEESLSIPYHADAGSLQSEYKDGQLKVTFNKKK